MQRTTIPVELLYGILALLLWLLAEAALRLFHHFAYSDEPLDKRAARFSPRTGEKTGPPPSPETQRALQQWAQTRPPKDI